MYYELIILGLVTIGAPYLAKLAGYKDELRPFTLVGISGVFFLMAAGFGLGLPIVETYVTVHQIGDFLLKLSIMIGWVLMSLAGLLGITAAYHNVGHDLAHKKV